MKRLLIIEDIAAEAEILTRLYQMVRARFHGAVDITNVPTWKDAVMVVETARPDMILCDLGLPDSSTDTTVSSLGIVSSVWPPVMVITGHDEREKELRVDCIRKAGAQDFMLKKVAHRDPEQLAERLWHAWLRTQHAKEAHAA